MDRFFYEKFIEFVSKSRVLAKLSQMAKNISGGNLAIILNKNHKLRKIIPSGKDADLPDFCKMIRSTEEGAKMCMNCRALIGVACYRGTCEHSCHGGVATLAAPVFYPKGNASDFIVVTTCAFREHAEQAGWKPALANLSGMPLDMNALKKAFYDLKRLNPGEMAMVKQIVESGAEALKDIIDAAFADIRLRNEESEALSANTAQYDRLQFNLQKVMSLFEQRQSARSRKTLTDIICSLIERNPEAPFRVIDLAHAARLTPNHFSLLFKQQTGQSFNTYLTEQRMKKAVQLLMNRSLNIKQVALKSGFDDPSYFVRRFKQLKGLPPQKWRSSR